MKIRTRLRIGVALLVLVLAATAIAVAVTFQQVRIAEREHNAMHSVVEGLSELNILTYDYAMHPGERARLQWSAKHAAIAEVLEGLGSPSPSRRADVEKMRGDHKSIAELFARLVGHEAGDAGREGKAYEQSRETLVTQFLMRSHEMNGVVSRLLRQSEDEVTSIWQRFSWVMMASMMIIAPVMIGVSSWTGRSIARPVSQLRKGIEIIGTGNLDFRVGTDATDEIGELSRAFDQMTRDLRTVTASRDELDAQIAQRERAEKELQQEKNKLQTMADAMEYGLTIQDKDYNIIYQNRVLEEMFGGLGGKCYKVYEGIDTRCEGCPVEQAYRDGKSHTTDRKVILPTGEVSYWENTANPIRDAGGEIVACLEVARNITERKRADDVLKERTDELRKAVNLMAGREVRMAELKDQIRQLRAQLEQAGLTPVADEPLKEGQGAKDEV